MIQAQKSRRGASETIYQEQERHKSRCSGHDAKLKSSHVAFASTPSKTLSGTRGYWRGASSDDVFITWRSLAYGVGDLV